VSDQRALEALALRHGLDLGFLEVSIVPIGGAHAIGGYLERYGPRGLGLRLAGLCDGPEERHFRRALERSGLGSNLTRERMEELGFFVCEVNLEYELVRALGVAQVERIIENEGELASFHTYRKQPAHRHEPLQDQLWGFMWNRKVRYAALLADALEPVQVPRPLSALLTYVSRPG
jgi:hypothetical protein